MTGSLAWPTGRPKTIDDSQTIAATLEAAAEVLAVAVMHIVLDNYHSHEHDINQWLAKHTRIALHFTPTSGSWLNLVEVFFSVITR